MTAAVDFLGVQARLQPDRVLATELASGRHWNYAEFDLAVARCASVLLQKDIGPGDRVASLAKNCAELIMLHMACARIAAIYVPLNWRLSAAELKGLLEDTEPGILFGDARRILFLEVKKVLEKCCCYYWRRRWNGTRDCQIVRDIQPRHYHRYKSKDTRNSGQGTRTVWHRL
jgi:acyl-CoA synthetase (AMP-forming)/AMP-acid ligase II